MADLTGRLRFALPWRQVLRLSILVAVVLAVIVAAFTAFLLVLPIAIIGGIALRFYLKRQVVRRARPGDVIEAEYTVIDR